MTLHIDKERIASSFSKAAVSYDDYATLQQLVGERLMGSIGRVEKPPESMLDLGSGTGFFSKELVKKHPDSSLFCLDIAQGMLYHAIQCRELETSSFVCADAEYMPFKNDSFDLVFSSLAIQWCTSLAQLYSEIERVLTVGGRAVISTLGPKSLFELRESWAGVDTKVHVNNFLSMECLLSTLPRGLVCESSASDMITLEYEKLSGLTSELKKIGAHNMNQQGEKGLTGRAKIEAFKRNYELRRQSNGKLPASYEVIYLVLNKVS